MPIRTSLSLLLLLLIFHFVKSKHKLDYVVKEESDNGTYIGNILADSRLNDLILTGGDIGIQLYEDRITGLFQVDGKTGQLTVAGRIDRESICPQRGGVSASSSFPSSLSEGISYPLSICQVELIAHIPPDNWINIAVIIEDINDHAPTFKNPDQLGGRMLSSPNVVYISEGVSVGYEVPLSGATDEDIGPNGIQSYDLSIEDVDNSTFALRFVLPGELNLVVKKKLDYEEKASYRGQLKACDGGRPTPKCAHQNITIFITDINDNKPQFEKELYEVRISEATPVMSVIIAITATDADSGDLGKLIYRFGQFYDPNVANFFGINEKTGEVWVKSPLDAKVISHFKIPVIAQDGGTIPKTGTTMLQIDIDDVNNHSPWIEIKSTNLPLNAKEQMKDGYVQLRIEENQPIGTQIGIVLTGDKDVGPNGEVHCDLKKSNSPFILRHSSSGRERKMYSLQSKVRFDLEDMPTSSPLSLQLECSDSGNPKLVSRQNIQVTVVDVNEFPAYFTKSQSNVVIHLPENAPLGSLVTRIQATDNDATPKMEFKLENDRGGLFRIDASSGDVFTQEKFDRELLSEHHFSVRLIESDIFDSSISRAGSDLANVTVILDDINDNAPLLESTRNFKIPENRPAYSDVIGQLKAYDPDLGENGTVRFLSSNNLFDVNPVTGKIYAKTVLDREIVSQYEIDVELTDLGHPVPQKTLERIIINVDDINDNKPMWRTPEKMHQEIIVKSVSSIIRNGEKNTEIDGTHCVAFVNISHRVSALTHVVKLMAVDADAEQNANLSFSMRNGNYYSENGFSLSDLNVLNLAQSPQHININEHFKIDPITWVLSTAAKNGALTSKSGLFEIYLRVSDNGQPPLHSDAVIYIYNENRGTSFLGILQHGRSVLLIGLICLLICMILCPVLIYLVRIRRNSQECQDGGVITCAGEERSRQEDPTRGSNAEVDSWAKEQMFLTQQPFLNSFDITSMSNSMIRCPTDRDTINFGQITNLPFQGYPPVTPNLMRGFFSI
ncbi:hypothetical protein Aperf_G00000030623 [Anoplocephala perfoliata]